MVMQLKSSLRRGDLVMVITGKDKGKQGKITAVDTATQRVVVEGVNVVKRHTKARMGQEAGIVTKEAGIHVSNVMIVDPKSGKPSRIGHKILADGKKVRVAKRSGEVLSNG